MGNKPSKRNFSLLPPHIIAQILKNLDLEQRLNAARVCKSWYYASCDPSINRNICVRIGDEFDGPDNFNRPFNSLLLSRTNFKKFKYSVFLKKFGHNIEFVEFDNCEMFLHELIDCVILMPNLSSLKIWANKTFVNALHTVECDDTVLGNNLKRIENLHVSLDGADCGGLAFLMNMMPNLKSISFAPQFSCVEYIYNTLFNYIDMFDVVCLDELVLGTDFHRLYDDFFGTLFQSKSNLNIRSLTLRGNHHLRVFNYKKFCEKFASLESLSMRCPRIYHEHMLDMMCRYMPKLTELELTKLPCLKIQKLGALQHLQKLTLGYRDINVEDEENHLSELFAKLNNLRDLEIYGFVTKNVLLSICENCKNLTSLQLSHVDVHNFSPIFQYLQKLERLYLIFDTIPDRNDDKIVYDITNLPFLDDLTISEFVPGMTLELVKELPILKQVTIHPIYRRCGTFPCKVIQFDVNH